MFRKESVAQMVPMESYPDQYQLLVVNMELQFGQMVLVAQLHLILKPCLE